MRLPVLSRFGSTISSLLESEQSIYFFKGPLATFSQTLLPAIIDQFVISSLGRINLVAIYKYFLFNGFDLQYYLIL